MGRKEKSIPAEIVKNHILPFAGSCQKADDRHPIWYQPIDNDVEVRRDLLQAVRGYPVYNPYEISWKCREAVLRSMQHELFGFGDKPMRAMQRNARFTFITGSDMVGLGGSSKSDWASGKAYKYRQESSRQTKVTLDTGANSANYISGKLIQEIRDSVYTPLFLTQMEIPHVVMLGDGQHKITVEWCAKLFVAFEIPEESAGKRNTWTQPVEADFWVIPGFGGEAIIGLPDILGKFWDFFNIVLQVARQNRINLAAEQKKMTEHWLRYYSTTAVVPAPMSTSWRQRLDPGILNTNMRKKRFPIDVIDNPMYPAGANFILTSIAPDGTNIANYTPPSAGVWRVMNKASDLAVDKLYGELYDPWANPIEICPEEEETPEPTSFGLKQKS